MAFAGRDGSSTASLTGSYLEVLYDRFVSPSRRAALAGTTTAGVKPAGIELTSREQADAWAGRRLSSTELDRLGEAIPHSSIPDAIGEIVAGFDEREDRP